MSYILYGGIIGTLILGYYQSPLTDWVAIAVTIGVSIYNATCTT